MKNKRLQLNELIAKGSKSFQRLNQGAGDQVLRPREPGAATSGAVDAGTSHAATQRFGARESLEAARADARSTAGDARSPLVTFELFRVNPLDAEAKYASVKYLLDALRYAKLIFDDKDRDIRLVVLQYRVDAFRKEATAITIDYP